MPKHRTITGLGPLALTLSYSTASPITGSWVNFGPLRGTQVQFQASFTATSAGLSGKVQAALATASTNWIVDVASRLSSLSSAVVYGTSTQTFARFRIASTALSTGTGTQLTGYLGAVI